MIKRNLITINRNIQKSS